MGGQGQDKDIAAVVKTIGLVDLVGKFLQWWRAEDSVVPDGLFPGIWQPDLPERGRPRPEAQLWPSHGLRVPAWSFPEVTLALPWEQDAPPATSAWRSVKYTGEQDLCWVASRSPKSWQMGGSPQLVDIVRDVETRRKESLRKAVTRERPAENQTAATCYSVGTEGG